MKNEDLYGLLVTQNFDDVISFFKSRNIDELNYYEIISFALANAFQGRIGYSKKILDKINPSVCNEEEESLLLETKMLIAKSKNGDLSKLVKLSNQALEKNANAVFAKSLIAQICFLEKKIDKGVSIYKSILDAYPSADWVFLRLSQYLVNVKLYNLALEYIPNIKQISLKYLYWIMASLLLPYRYLFIIITAILLLLKVTSDISFIVLSLCGLLIIIFGIIKRDSLIQKTFITYLVYVIFLMLILPNN